MLFDQYLPATDKAHNTYESGAKAVVENMKRVTNKAALEVD